MGIYPKGSRCYIRLMNGLWDYRADSISIAGKSGRIRRQQLHYSPSLQGNVAEPSITYLGCPGPPVLCTFAKHGNLDFRLEFPFSLLGFV